MFSRSALLLGAVLALPAALPAQDLQIPDDWTWTTDAPATQATEQDVGPDEFRYVRMPPGWHVTTTTSGITLFPKDRTVDGRFGVEVEAFWFPNRVDGEWAMPGEAPWGLAFDHAESTPDNPHRMEFLIRRDGAVALRATMDGETRLLAEWKSDSTVKPHNGKDITKYVLRMEYVNERVTFAVNGKQILNVEVGPAPYAVVPGLRVGPGRNQHISRYDLLSPLAPPKS
jgi:hypothetical protein